MHLTFLMRLYSVALQLKVQQLRRSLFGIFIYCDYILMFLYLFLSFILSFFHSFILSFFHSFILSFFHSFILSFFHSFILSFFHSFILSFFHSFILSFFHSSSFALFDKDLSNVGNRETKFSFHAQAPFSVSPTDGFLEINSSMQVSVHFTPEVCCCFPFLFVFL